MKKLSSFFVFLLAASLMQAQWKWVNPYPTPNDLHDFFLLPNEEGWAAGDHGTVIYTPDGGDTWEDRSPAISEKLNAVFFHNSLEGMAAGDNGRVIRTSDGGLHWDTCQSPVTANLTCIAFNSPSSGFIFGEYCCISTFDGGATWWQEAIQYTSFAAVTFPDEMHGWAVGNSPSLILHTDDGGNSWQVQEDLPQTYKFFDIFFSDSLHGCAVGVQGKVYITQDGGNTWELRYGNTGATMQDVFFVTPTDAFACGAFEFQNSSSVVKTADGGYNWTLCENLDGLSLAGIAFTGMDHGICLGKEGAIMLTDQGGYGWIRKDTTFIPDYANLNCTCFEDAQCGWVGGVGRSIYLTSDAGLTWDIGFLPESSTTTPEVSCICFWDELRGYAAGVAGYFYLTEDGGLTWTEQETGVEDNLNDACFTDELHGWFVGNNNTIMRTNDGGITWVSQESMLPYNTDFLNVDFQDTLNGWICGGRVDETGLILHTYDGGGSWEVQMENQGWPAPVNCLFFRDSLHGWAGSVNDWLFFTSDGGATWDWCLPFMIFSGSLSDITDLYFSDTETGWIACNDGNIYYTDDGGTSFKQQVYQNGKCINSIWFTDDGYGWAVGDSGIILSTNNGGFPVPVEKPGPECIQVSTLEMVVYPNPARSDVTVYYILDHPAYVQLEIFNSGGHSVFRENQDLQGAGGHIRHPDIQNLPSGIYLCRLQAGDQTIVKRLIKL